MRNRSLPGRHITDCQMRLYMRFRQTETARVAAAKAGFGTASAYRFERDPRLRSQKKVPRGRRRPDPLAAVWESEIVPMLARAPELRAVAIFEEIRRRHSQIGAGVRRTVERRVRAWRALNGIDAEILPELTAENLKDTASPGYSGKQLGHGLPVWTASRVSMTNSRWLIKSGQGRHRVVNRPTRGEGGMLDGVMLLWFLLAAVSLLFVSIDIRTTPESPVLKWGFVLVTAYIGVVGAFLYVLGCREPLPGLHERYVAARWRQTLGSTMHCVAGDGVGILAGAVLASALKLGGMAEVIVEYILGFAFGWMIFQALFMREMAGGSYSRALRNTFIPELLSMNLLMAGMVPTAMALRAQIAYRVEPLMPAFWFVMSIGLLIGFVVAYPINWWLVANHLKHGMMTVRPAGRFDTMQDSDDNAVARSTSHVAQNMVMEARPTPRPPVLVMALLSFAALAAGLAIASSFGAG
jgi:hypothetical protein